jgi:hypothetical protein
MKYRLTTLLASAAGAFAALTATAAYADDAQPAATAAPAPAPAPAPTPPPYPAMSASLAGNSTPITLDLGILGSKVTVGGVLSGYAQTQTNPVFNFSTGKKDQSSSVDLSNAQIFINKSDGFVQYFIQAGTYSLPALGPFPYTPSAKQPGLTYGNLSQGFLKLVPNSNFSIEVGALPTLVGDEYTFSFENLNVTRGLLWGYEPAVSRGVQANLTEGPFALSVAWTDGFYSGKYNSISGLATWTINSANTLAVDAEVPTGKVNVVTSATFPPLANESIYNIMYTHTAGQWLFNPYLQYTKTPSSSFFGYKGVDSWGAALLVNYAFDSKSKFSGLSVPFRIEYLSSQGSSSSPAQPDILFAPGAKTWSFTVTPTYQFKQYFIRVEASYVTASHIDPYAFFLGTAYGTSGDKKDQFKGLIETGVMF